MSASKIQIVSVDGEKEYFVSDAKAGSLQKYSDDTLYVREKDSEELIPFSEFIPEEPQAEDFKLACRFL